MPEPPIFPVSVSPWEYVVSLVINPGKRISALLFVAYVAGIGGILLSLLGDPANPRSIYGVVGIVLMGVSFFCMFGLAVTMVNLADDGEDA